MSDENAQVFETVQDAVPESDAPESNGAEYDESGQAVEGEESGEQSEEFGDGELEAKAKDPWYKRRIDELTKDKHEARRHLGPHQGSRCGLGQDLAGAED